MFGDSHPSRSFEPAAATALYVGCGVLLFLLGRRLDGAAYASRSAAAVALTIVLALGFERAGTLFMILALFFSPMNIIRVVAGGCVDHCFRRTLRRRNDPADPDADEHSGCVCQRCTPRALPAAPDGFIASLTSSSPLLSLLLMSKFIIAGLVMPLVFMLWRPNLRLILIMAIAYVCGNVISVAYSFVDPVQVFRSYGLTTHVNNLGYASLLSLALVPFIFRLIPRWMQPALCDCCARVFLGHLGKRQPGGAPGAVRVHRALPAPRAVRPGCLGSGRSARRSW